jgi:hypothetical protein
VSIICSGIFAFTCPIAIHTLSSKLAKIK